MALLSWSIAPAHDASRADLRVIARVPRCCLRGVARVGQFLDVVHKTIELPLRVDFHAVAQCESIDALIMAQIRIHRIDGRERTRRSADRPLIDR